MTRYIIDKRMTDDWTELEEFLEEINRDLADLYELPDVSLGLKKILKPNDVSGKKAIRS